jgi:hypothetical protein
MVIWRAYRFVRAILKTLELLMLAFLVFTLITFKPAIIWIGRKLRKLNR